MDQNGKFVSVKKTCLWRFLPKIWDPENFTFALENSKNGQTSEAREKAKKIFKKKTKKAHIKRGKIRGIMYTEQRSRKA